MGEGLGEGLGEGNAPLLSFGDKVLEKCLEPLELEVYSSSWRLCRSLCVLLNSINVYTCANLPSHARLDGGKGEAAEGHQGIVPGGVVPVRVLPPP